MRFLPARDRAILFLLALLFVVLASFPATFDSCTLSRVARRNQKQCEGRYMPLPAAALLVVAGAIVFPWVYEPWRPAKAPCNMGTTCGTDVAQRLCSGRTSHFLQGAPGDEGAREATFSPHNPARLLYTVACAKDGSESGVFYFDGARGAPVQVNPLGMDEPGDWFDSFWSPDDKFVVIPAYGHATLVNLQTGQRSDFLRTCSPRKMPFFRASNFAAGHQMERNWLSSSLRPTCARIARCSASRTWYL